MVRFLQTRELEKEVAQMAQVVDRSIEHYTDALIVDGGALPSRGPTLTASSAALRACPDAGARAFPPGQRLYASSNINEPLDVPPPTHVTN